MSEELKPQPPAGQPRRVATLHLEFDLDSFILSISGTVPTNEMALDMARRLVDECAFTVNQARVKVRGDHLLPPHMPFPPMRGRG